MLRWLHYMRIRNSCSSSCLYDGVRCAIGRVALQIEAMDAGVGMVAQLGFSKRLTPLQEDNMVGQPPILFFQIYFTTTYRTPNRI